MSNINVVLRVDGMTCVGCEKRIERALLSMPGVLAVRVSFRGGTARITYDAGRASPAELKRRIEASGYSVAQGGGERTPRRALTAAGVAVLFFAAYLLARHLGLLDFLNFFPEVEANMGYGMLFVTGLVTSVHCAAMCGGINLSQCIPEAAQGGGTDGRLGNLRAGLLYNVGRVASYTLSGGIVGAVGSIVSFSGAARGIVLLVAGLFMGIMGLNMLQVFPWLRKLNLSMPRVFTRRASTGKRSNSPLYVGLLNGLMPCGPLQAMQLYALSTGDPLQGALSMLLFSLGTVPLMFGLGALSAMMSKRFTHRMMTAGAVLVLMLGASMFINGLNLSGVGIPVSLSLPGAADQTGAPVEPATPDAATSPDDPAAAPSDAASPMDSVQRVTTQLSPRKYEPITVEVGIPVQWTIHAAPGTLTGCNNQIILPEYGYLEKKLNYGDNLVEFTPTRTGTFPYTCWMGMMHSTITVVDGDAPAATA